MPFTLRFALTSVALSTAVFLLFLNGWGNTLPLLVLTFLWPWLPRQRPRGVPLWTLPVLVPFTLLYVWHALSPEVQPDSLQYHLTLPRLTETTGTFPKQVSFYNLLPQGMELLFAMAAAWAGERTAKLLHLFYLAATIPVLLAIARKLEIDTKAAWCAALFYFVTPVVGTSATCTYNDAALAFFTLAVFWMLLEDRPWLAGLLAGFCYAIKLPGGLVPVAGVIWYLARRDVRGALRVGLASALVMAPWLIRNTALTGNPVAPLMNAWFPNPAFHIESERELSRWLRDYGGVSWWSIPWEAAVRGGALQGLVGPAWLVLAGMLAWRRNGLLLGAGAVAAVPWLLNAGTRFLMPSLPFLSLAAFARLPRHAAVALLAVHSLLSLPPVVRLYTASNAWTLPLVPASGSELRDLAKFVEENTGRDARILDLAGAPAAITDRELIGAWQTAAGDRMVGGLRFAASNDAALWRTCGTRTEVALRSLLVELPGAMPRSIAIHEVELRDGKGQRLKPTALWALGAEPNPWEPALAVDGNPVSAWRTWEPVRGGMHWEVDFAVAESVATVCVWLPENYPVRVEGWPLAPPERQAALNYRRAATRYLAREGVTHVLAAETGDAFGEIAIDMARRTDDWGLERRGTVGNAALYQVR
ncbi:MAG: DUF2029 domain-containing protein [Bryobacterales bacterium]|nr:DUF2029 domain-containing protein [Bryobacterales bacterium]